MSEETAHSEEKPVTNASEQRQGETSRRFWEYAKTIFVTLIVALFLKTFVVEAFRIPSGSMENTLLVGDFLLVNKFIYGFRTPRYVPLTNVAIPSFTLPAFKGVRRGDVIVFEFPGERDQQPNVETVNYIKRCIGLPGDTVEIQLGRVFVNGKELSLPAHAKPSNTTQLSHWRRSYRLFPRGAGFTEEHYGPLVVPKKGDVIDINLDTIERWRRFIVREGHRVELSSDGKITIDGQDVARYTVERNYYFAMGDNRDNSLDSRYWGFVPADHLIGEALVVYWSWDPDLSISSFTDKLHSIRWGRVFTLIR